MNNTHPLASYNQHFSLSAYLYKDIFVPPAFEAPCWDNHSYHLDEKQPKALLQYFSKQITWW